MNSNWRGYRLAAWVGLVLLAGAVVLTFVQSNFRAAFSLLGFLVAAFVFVKWDDKLPNLFDFLFVLSALINAGGWAFDLYNKPGPYDEIAHAFTIFALTLALGFLVYGRLMSNFHGRYMLFVLTIASFGIAIGALWEVAEWLSDFVLPQQIVSGLNDTITDIILDSLGAIAASLLSVRTLHEKSPEEWEAEGTWTTNR